MQPKLYSGIYYFRVWCLIDSRYPALLPHRLRSSREPFFSEFTYHQGIFLMTSRICLLGIALIVFSNHSISAQGKNNALLVSGGQVTSAASDSPFTELVWSDEFDGSGPIDAAKWHHQTQLPDGVNWFNGELQHYTNRLENSFVENGTLHIVAKKEVFTDQGQTKQFTSARLNSKFAFTYGRVEVKAKLPEGVGTWPAIWMLGKNISEPGAYWQLQGHGTTGWPACGEVDIMEHWGTNQDFVQSAMHTPSSFGDTEDLGGTFIADVSNEYHIYEMEWNEDQFEFSVDGIVHYVYAQTRKIPTTGLLPRISISC